MDDWTVLARLAQHLDEMKADFESLRAAHVMGEGGPLFQAFSRFAVGLDMERTEIRLIARYLGGQS